MVQPSKVFWTMPVPFLDHMEAMFGVVYWSILACIYFQILKKHESSDAQDIYIKCLIFGTKIGLQSESKTNWTESISKLY